MSRAPNKRSDAELLALARAEPDSRAGRRATSELFGRYQGRVFHWCLRLVGNRERAMELAQDSLLGAYRGLDSFGERARFSSWLFSIVRNRCLSELRRAPLLVDESADPGALAGASPGPDLDLERKEDVARVFAAMKRRLAPVEQEALWLRAGEGLPVDEITRVLGIDGATGARAVIQTARRKLRAEFARERRPEDER